jgi:hypothetical protein
MLTFAESPQLQWWGFTLKAAASVVAIVGACLAVIKYLDEKSKANQTAKIESQKPFSVKQQEVYFDLLSTTAFIANRVTEPSDDPDRKHAIEHFWCLFWGPLPVVANQKVAVAADAFSVALDKPMDFIPLRNASMDLARACRVALGIAWSIGLEEYSKGEAAIAKPIPKLDELYSQSGRYSF